MSSLFVGIDVSKDSLQVCERVDRCTTDQYVVPNSSQGCRKLARSFAHSAPAAIVFEATGGYERLLRRTLADAGIPASQINPFQARAFACYKNQFAKTDPIDAKLLASMAEEGRPSPTPPPDPLIEEIRDLTIRLSQLVRMTTMEKNRLHQASKAIRPSVLASIRHLKNQQRAVSTAIEDKVRSHALLSRRLTVLQSIKGVGPRTAISLIALLPELGAIPHKQLAALAGVAPVANDSGRSRGARVTRGGRAPVRQALYMSALAATRCNPQLRVFYLRLVGNGRPKKVALVAVMNKLLRVMNALITSDCLWSATHGCPAAGSQILPAAATLEPTLSAFSPPTPPAPMPTLRVAPA